MKRYIIFFISFVVFAPAIGQKRNNSNDTTKSQIVASKFYYDYSGLYRTPIDTSIKQFQIYNPAFSNFSINQYNGNLGLPFQSSTGDEQTSYTDFLFDQYIRYNFHKPEDIIYYNTTSPFTKLTYFTGGPKSRQEQKLDILHVQNVNEKLGVGFLGTLSSSDGEFTNQKASKNCFSLFSSYDGKRYSYHFDISFNSFKANENGGVFSDSLYENLPQAQLNTIPVSIEAASSRTKNFSIFLQHRFYLTGSYKEEDLSEPVQAQKTAETSIKALNDTTLRNDSTLIDTVKVTPLLPAKKISRWNEVLSLVHQFHFDRYSRSYTDDLTVNRYNGSLERSYYNNVFIDSTQTQDSLAFKRIENTLFLAVNAYSLLKIPAELRVGIKSQMDFFSYNGIPVLPDTQQFRRDESHINTALVGTLFNRISKTITFAASAELYFTGYKSGNLRINGDISKTIGKSFKMTLMGDFSVETPQYFVQDFESNHFQWHNNYTSKQSTNIIKAQISHEKLKIFLEGSTGTYINYIYFNEMALPTMATVPFVVNMIALKKYFDAGFFHTMFKVKLQTSGDQSAMPLPAFAGFNSTYTEFQLVKNVLRMQLGFDAFYNTAYYANAYMPATGMYFTQNEKKIGNYPYADVFLNIKLKRARFSIKYENITSLFNSRSGYFIPHHPFNPGIIKFGVSWTFYD
jgi:hypothetical protein